MEGGPESVKLINWTRVRTGSATALLIAGISSLFVMWNSHHRFDEQLALINGHSLRDTVKDNVSQIKQLNKQCEIVNAMVEEIENYVRNDENEMKHNTGRVKQLEENYWYILKRLDREKI